MRLNYKESNDDIRETAAIFDAMLNFSKCSRVTKVHLADSENRLPGLPKTIKKKLTLTFPGSAKICHLAPRLLAESSTVTAQGQAVLSHSESESAITHAVSAAVTDPS